MAGTMVEDAHAVKYLFRDGESPRAAACSSSDCVS